MLVPRISRCIASVGLAATILCACAMPQHASVLPAGSESDLTKTSSHRSARVELRLKIPKRRKGARYISPSTQSIVVTEGTHKLGTFDTTPASPGCTTVYGATTCSFTLGMIPGASQTIVVDSYDAAAGAGNLLASGQVTTTIVAGFNAIPITMGGVVASVAIALQNPNSAAGTAIPAPGLAITVMAKDADGNTIVGPGAYVAPIALNDSDASGATTLVGASVTSPSSRPALTYSGASVTTATIGATVTGVPPSAVTPATFVPTPNIAGNFILPTVIGSAADLSVEPIGITNGPDGNLWVGAFDNTVNHAIMVMSPTGTWLNTWVPGVAPSTNLPQDSFYGLAVGSDHNIWYIGESNVGNITTNGVATNYPLSSVTGVCSSAAGARIVPASDGGLWFTVTCPGIIPAQLVHVTTGGVFTVNNLPSNVPAAFGLVVGKDGNVYVAVSDNSRSGAILQATVSGSTITGTTMVDIPNSGQILVGVAQSTDGDLWMTNGGCNTSLITRLHLSAGFAPSSVTSFPTISGCEQPEYLIALADGSLWVPEGTALVTQVIPHGEGAPSLYDVAFYPTHSILGEGYDAAIGNNGNVYFTDFHQNKAGFSSNVFEVAY